MSLIIKNQENNWAYVLIVVALTAIAGGIVVFYSVQTVEEITTLSSYQSVMESQF
jgi:hypothetical protein